MSLISCSDTNWPRLATNRVEHGLIPFIPCEGGDDPTGEGRAGEGRKWGIPLAWCMAVRAAVGWGMFNDCGGAEKGISDEK